MKTSTSVQEVFQNEYASLMLDETFAHIMASAAEMERITLFRELEEIDKGIVSVLALLIVAATIVTSMYKGSNENDLNEASKWIKSSSSVALIVAKVKLMHPEIPLREIILGIDRFPK